MKVKPLSRVRLLATPWTAAHQAPPIHGSFQARVLEWGARGVNNTDLLDRIPKVTFGFDDLLEELMGLRIAIVLMATFLLQCKDRD